LGISDFARYGIILAILSLVSSFNLGLPQAVVRALSKYHDNHIELDSIWATSSVLFIITGIVGSVIAVGLAYFMNVDTNLLPMIFALVLINYLVTHYLTLPHAHGHFGYFNAKTFIVGTANTYLSAYLSTQGFDLLIILNYQLASYLLTLLILAYFSLKYFPKPWLLHSNYSRAKSLISFGLKNQLGTIVGQIQAQYAKFLLSTLNPLSLSAYMIASGLVQKLTGGIVQLSSALYPATSRNRLSPDFKELYIRMQFGLVGIGILGVILYNLWGFDFLSWWLRSNDLVNQVHAVLNILVLYFLILVLTPLPSSILDGRGRPELTSIFATITVAIEIGLAFILLPRYGILAPGYSALIAVSLTTPILLFVTSRMLQSKS